MRASMRNNDADNEKRLFYVPPHKRARFKLVFDLGLISVC